jgi:hypothetical protein
MRIPVRSSARRHQRLLGVEELANQPVEEVDLFGVELIRRRWGVLSQIDGAGDPIGGLTDPCQIGTETAASSLAGVVGDPLIPLPVGRDRNLAAGEAPRFESILLLVDLVDHCRDGAALVGLRGSNAVEGEAECPTENDRGS